MTRWVGSCVCGAVHQVSVVFSSLLMCVCVCVRVYGYVRVCVVVCGGGVSG